MNVNNNELPTGDIRENESLYIKEVQKFLRLLSRYDNDLTPLIPDGVYGPETREEVAKFQRLQGIPVTGIVDFVTWNILYSEYKKALEFAQQANFILPFGEVGNGGTVSDKDSGNIVYIIQIMLETLGVVYRELIDQPINGTFDEITKKNVREFQLKNNLDPTGEVDKITWNKLAESYNDQMLNGDIK